MHSFDGISLGNEVTARTQLIIDATEQALLSDHMHELAQDLEANRVQPSQIDVFLGNIALNNDVISQTSQSNLSIAYSMQPDIQTAAQITIRSRDAANTSYTLSEHGNGWSKINLDAEHISVIDDEAMLVDMTAYVGESVFRPMDDLPVSSGAIVRSLVTSLRGRAKQRAQALHYRTDTPLIQNGYIAGRSTNFTIARKGRQAIQGLSIESNLEGIVKRYEYDVTRNAGGRALIRAAGGSIALRSAQGYSKEYLQRLADSYRTKDQESVSALRDALLITAAYTLPDGARDSA